MKCYECCKTDYLKNSSKRPQKNNLYDFRVSRIFLFVRTVQQYLTVSHNWFMVIMQHMSHIFPAFLSHFHMWQHTYIFATYLRHVYVLVYATYMRNLSIYTLTICAMGKHSAQSHICQICAAYFSASLNKFRIFSCIFCTQTGPKEVRILRKSPAINRNPTVIHCNCMWIIYLCQGRI